MKPVQLARLLGVSVSSIQKWSREQIAEFLSPNAAGGDGRARSYTDQDARILAWVATLKAQNIPLREIQAMLRAAQANHWQDLPLLPGGVVEGEPVTMIPLETAETRYRSLQERYEVQLQLLRERYELQLQAVTRERDQLQTRLARTEDEAVELRQQMASLTEQLLDLNRRLTALLEKEQKRRK